MIFALFGKLIASLGSKRISLAKCSFRSFALIVLVTHLILCEKTEAQFASKFSLAVGEEYNDNIFFSKRREHDFITQITPTLTFLYQPAAATAPTLKFDISPTAQVFARHPEENNFGRNTTLGGDYTFAYSPRLSFDLSESFRLLGGTRTLGTGTFSRTIAPTTPTGPLAPGLSQSQSVGNFISNGDTLSNAFSVRGSYLFNPNVTFSSHYANTYSRFLDAGGSDVSNEMGVRGVYKWRQEHNLHGGYTITLLNPRDGETSVVHSIDIGDDFLSNTQIVLTPTLTLSGSTGISLNTGRDGPRVANNSTVTLIKLWETASLTAGFRKSLTNSFGVSGVSDTMTLFSTYHIILSDRLTGGARVEYSRYDTDATDFNTLQVSSDLQYTINSWLCSGFRYSHQRLTGGSGGRNTIIGTNGNIYGNSVFLVLSAHFDIWPNFARSRGQGCGGGLPGLAPRA